MTLAGSRGHPGCRSEERMATKRGLLSHQIRILLQSGVSCYDLAPSALRKHGRTGPCAEPWGRGLFGATRVWRKECSCNRHGQEDATTCRAILREYLHFFLLRPKDFAPRATSALVRHTETTGRPFLKRFECRSGSKPYSIVGPRGADRYRKGCASSFSKNNTRFPHIRWCDKAGVGLPPRISRRWD